VEWSTEGLKFGQVFANQTRRRLPAASDKWHLDEVVVAITGVKHCLGRAVDQNGMVVDILVQSRRDTRAAKRLLCKLLKRQCCPPRVMITDKLASYGAAKRAVMPSVEHRKQLARHHGAKSVVRFQVDYIFPNCPCYIPELRLTAASPHPPAPGVTPPAPAWKPRDYIRDKLPAGYLHPGVLGNPEPPGYAS